MMPSTCPVATATPHTREDFVMNKPIGFEKMNATQRALEVARHELVTLSGLQAADATAPHETFTIDTNEAIRLIDVALKERRTK